MTWHPWEGAKLYGPKHCAEDVTCPAWVSGIARHTAQISSRLSAVDARGYVLGHGTVLAEESASVFGEGVRAFVLLLDGAVVMVTGWATACVLEVAAEPADGSKVDVRAMARRGILLALREVIEREGGGGW